ncbi:MAG: nucleotide-binding protein [Candidatus Bathyarchaeota archaeon]|nr:nucleotide-binding protein [Candidatus Bathyarchaeota archaeon]
MRIDPIKSLALKKEIFISHGKDLKPLNELKDMLVSFGLTPVVLSEQPSGGKTVIEKLEAYSDVGFAFVILTPDDLGGYAETGSVWSRPKRLRKFLRTAHTRPRQNVVLEFGFFVGKLGRDRVACLLKKPVEQPSDMQGIVYLSFKQTLEEIRMEISKELRAAGYEIAEKSA